MYHTRIHIWTTTEQDLSTQRKVTQNRYGNLALTKRRPETPSLLWFRNHDKGEHHETYAAFTQKNIARGRDRSGASGPWITITRPRVDRICTREGMCGCAGEEKETLCACSLIRYTRNGYCACFWTPPASLVCYQWSGPNHVHTLQILNHYLATNACLSNGIILIDIISIQTVFKVKELQWGHSLKSINCLIFFEY